MPEYRDPKVTTTEGKKNDMMKWVGIAVAAIIVLLLLGWLLGWFAGDEEEIEATDPAVVEEPVEVD